MSHAHLRTLPNRMVKAADQARIQDFAQGVATAKRGPEISGPRCQEPQGTPPPIKNLKVCGFGPLVFSRDPLTVLFSAFYYLILCYFAAQGGASAPVPPLDESLQQTYHSSNSVITSVVLHRRDPF